MFYTHMPAHRTRVVLPIRQSGTEDIDLFSKSIVKSNGINLACQAWTMDSIHRMLQKIVVDNQKEIVFRTIKSARKTSHIRVVYTGETHYPGYYQIPAITDEIKYVFGIMVQIPMMLLLGKDLAKENGAILPFAKRLLKERDKKETLSCVFPIQVLRNPGITWLGFCLGRNALTVAQKNPQHPYNSVEFRKILNTISSLSEVETIIDSGDYTKAQELWDKVQKELITTHIWVAGPGGTESYAWFGEEKIIGPDFFNQILAKGAIDAFPQDLSDWSLDRKSHHADYAYGWYGLMTQYEEKFCTSTKGNP